MRHAAIAWFLLAGQAVLKPAVPTEPIKAILDAFRTHAVVALSEGDHGNDQMRLFRLELLKNRRFPSTVNDVVLEGGSASYQDVVDRFVNGEDVAEESVRAAWENSTQTQVALTGPNTTQFVREVRALNARLPKERRVRVLFGDPPIDWSSIRNFDDFLTVLALRDSFPAQLIRREVLARHRHALVLYGAMHFQRKQIFSGYDMSNPIAQTVVSLLESGSHPVTVFTIYVSPTSDLEPMQPDAASWRLPALATLRGTVLGRADFTKFYPTTRAVPPLRMEDQFDAVMSFGPRSAITFSPPPTDRCSDRTFVETMLARMSLAAVPQPVIDAARRTCEPKS